MKTFIAIIGFTLFVTQGFAAPAVVDVKTAIEHAYFTLGGLGTYEEVVQRSLMSAKQKKEVMAYLRGHEVLKKAPPVMKWKEGTATITFVSRKTEYSVDYTNMEKRQVSVNGKTISFPKDALFSDGVKLFQAARKNPTKGAFFGFPIINEASALDLELGGPAEEAGIMDYILLYSGTAGVMSCTFPDSEHELSADCPYRDNLSMIKSIFSGLKPKILELSCKNEKLERLTFSDGDGERYFEVTYDKYGVPINMKLKSNWYVKCNYPLDEEGKLIHNMGNNGLCARGRADNNLTAGSGLLKAGDVPRSFLNVPVSVTRLQNCCQEVPCRDGVKSMIAAEKSTAERKKEAEEAKERAKRGQN